MPNMLDLGKHDKDWWERFETAVETGSQICDAAMNLFTHVTYCRDMYSRAETCKMPWAHRMSFARKQAILRETESIMNWFVKTYSQEPDLDS